MTTSENQTIIGRAPEDLTIPERLQHAGTWIALELYQPTRLKDEGGRPVIDLKLRRIRAAGSTVDDCIRQLHQAGLDPANFEFTRLGRPY